MKLSIFKTMVIVVAVISLTAVQLYGQAPEVLWTKTYGGSGNEYEYASVQQTSDGGYIIAGATASFSSSYDIWIIKTDANGDTLWSRTFGGSGVDYAANVQQTADGGYIIGGTKNSSYYSGDLWLIKLDPNGTDVWNRTFHRGGGNVGDHWGFVQQTSDGGYILFGSSGSYYVAGQYDWWLIKTDENGDSLWSRTYGGNGTENAESVHQTQDGGYILSGNTNSFSPIPLNDLNFWLLKTNANGDSMWSHNYGGSGYHVGRGAQQTADGGYIQVGECYAPYPNITCRLIKTNANGIVSWDHTFGGSGDDYGFSVLQTDDGGYVVVGATSSYGAGGYDLWLLKTDANGDSLWSCTVGGSGDDWGRQGIDQTSDGGYIATGKTNSFGAGGYDLYLVRFGPGAPSVGTIAGSITPPYANITFDLLDTNNVCLASVLSAYDGSYSFPELSPGSYLVELVVPLGFEVQGTNPVLVTLAGGETDTINFTLTPTITMNDARSKGYWKHQVNANISGKGNTDYTTEELLAFSQEIFDRFYGNYLNPIQVSGVTYVGDSAAPLGMSDLQNMLNINQGGSTMHERACQQYLTLLLNVVSYKIAQYMPASADGATVSQAIVYINNLLSTNNSLAKQIAETLNEGQTVGAGVIPSTTPYIYY